MIYVCRKIFYIDYIMGFTWFIFLAWKEQRTFIFLETKSISWNQEYILKPRVYLETMSISWNHEYILKTRVYLETKSISWNQEYILKPRVYLETKSISWNQEYIVFLSNWNSEHCELLRHMMHLYMIGEIMLTSFSRFEN